jgi:hypothetical protein
MFPAVSFTQNSDDITDQVSVWNLTFVRTKANMGDEYLKNLKNTWASSMAEMSKEGLIESYMILEGNAFGVGDFDIILMVEFKNYATFDPDPARQAKIKEVNDKVAAAMGGEDRMEAVVQNYGDMRTIVGRKTMSEIKFK